MKKFKFLFSFHIFLIYNLKFTFEKEQTQSVVKMKLN